MKTLTLVNPAAIFAAFTELLYWYFGIEPVTQATVRFLSYSLDSFGYH